MGDLVPLRRRAHLTTEEVRVRQAQQWLEADRAKRDAELRHVKAVVFLLVALMFLVAAVVIHACAAAGVL